MPLLKHRGYKGRGAPFFIDNDPTAFFTGGRVVKADRRGRRSWRLDKDVGLDYQLERGNTFVIPA